MDPKSKPSSNRLRRHDFALVGTALALGLAAFHSMLWPKSESPPAIGVTGGAVLRKPDIVLELEPAKLTRRANSPTDVCTRFSHQSALVNGTLYVYGGEATTEVGQTENTWNNDFLSLDVRSTWQIAAPSLTGLPQPSGPPNVSLGYLWNSHKSLYLYGGEFSWKPVESPTAFSMWEYDIASSQWVEHSNPTTSSGVNADSNGDAVQRAAEGAGISVPGLGRGYYFGGHQDGYTTEGWSQSIERIYLKSLLEFTYPGYENDQVYTLSDNKSAGTDGNWRNITEGGTQAGDGFPERADGLLLYVPAYDEGILVGLAGGTNTTFTQMNVVDVYDIATSTWYKQATSGTPPKYRVNPCAVAAAAPDGTSYQIYMFGGQNLQPAGNQTQYNDLWILTIPAFTWIEVDQSSQSVPYGRSGHSCNVWDGQMVVVGGYVGEDLSCDSPGIYVFDLSTVEWVEQFTALSNSSSSSSGGSATASGSAASSSSTSASNAEVNPYNQQPAQMANASNPGGLEGSYGYTVPDIVISIVGGDKSGGATITKPVVTATAGPLATGKLQTYTVTQSGGSAVTETASPTSTSTSGSSGGKSSSGPNIGAIVAGVVAGVLLILVCYLAFCAWVYRKQLGLYKRHVEMAQKQSLNEKKRSTVPGLLPLNNDGSRQTSTDRRYLDLTGTNSGTGSASGAAQQDSRHNSDTGAYNSLLRRSSDASGGEEDLLAGQEPSFLGVMLAPRRSLRVINRD